MEPTQTKELIGIIGAGVMGQGIAHLCAKFSYRVVLTDVSQEVLKQAERNIRNTERFDILLQKQHKSPPGTNGNVMGSISFSTDLRSLAEAPVIIENVPEKLSVKEPVYRQLSEIAGPDTLVGVNTSATSITRLASHTKHPARVVGIHFSNPVNLMPTVEMIRGMYTSDATIEQANLFLRTLGMRSVLVNDSPGFVSNRVMLMYINEAVFCVAEGVGSAEAVDQIFRDCLSHTMGPLQTADLIGLDTILYSLEVLYNDFCDAKYRPAPLLRKMVDAKQLGRKSGQGFYKY